MPDGVAVAPGVNVTDGDSVGVLGGPQCGSGSDRSQLPVAQSASSSHGSSGVGGSRTGRERDAHTVDDLVDGDAAVVIAIAGAGARWQRRRRSPAAR